MRIEIKMPDLGTNEDEIKIVQWLIEPGQPVALGDELVEVETDKATMAVEAVAAGLLQEIKVPAEEVACTGQVIAILEQEAAEPDAAEPPPPAPAITAAAPPTRHAPAERPSSTPSRGGSMFARNRRAAAQRDAGQADVERVAISATQRIVGRRLQQSQQTAPHFYLQASLNAEPMASARRQAEKRIVWDAFVVKAVAAALEAFPRMRCRMEDEQPIRRSATAVGVAVDVDDDLFVVPVDDPGSKGVEEISRAIMAGVESIRRGEPEARKLQPAEITVTNLGGAGVDTFLPIINPPEASILSLSAIRPVVVAEAGQIKIQRRANLGLAVDHRIVNGRYAARFLGEIVANLEAL